jgi:hemoglobin-like flavoprotein
VGVSPEQLQLVRLTFIQISGRKQEAGRLFYDRLFAIAPETKPMFRGDMDVQATKLLDMLALAIGSFRDMSSLIPLLESLAVRHIGYGVRDADYDKVGEALFWTLEQILGPAFTPIVRAAWATLYGTIADVMRAAANGAAASSIAAAGR